jgi:branched-chain amino acid transport system substrate-binding protein
MDLRSVRSRVVVLAFTGTAFLGACGGAGGPGGDEVVFGLAAPLQRSYGESTRLGAELAVRELAARGMTIRLQLADDDADPEKAPHVAQRLVDDPRVVAVVGHVNSSTTIAAGGVYAAGGLPAVATSATSPAVSGLGDWSFRIASSDSANALVLARTAASLGRRIGILYSNEAYGRALMRSFRGALPAGAVELLSVDPYLDEMTDFTPFLERLRRHEAEVIFVAGIEEGASRIVPQARQLGMTARFMGGDGLEPLVGMGPAYDGIMVGMLFHPEGSPAAREFAAAFRAAFGREPDSFAATAYDAVHLLARAVEAVGPRRAAIRRHLAGVGRDGGSEPFQGVTGSLRFDERGDPIDKDFAVGQIRGDGIQLLNGAGAR